jgi:poly(hydroxyalkanoate) depolymerase family esterase
MPMAIAFETLTAGSAQAASLSGPITGWASGVPTYISMYIYVPAKVATNPPILVVSHYCGGTAAGVFGEAEGGGIVAASDQYGFIMIFPQTTGNGVCWDVSSTATETRNGAGDSHAIAEMVQYTIGKYSANANRVYATGTSSGAMMTELLLAVYPDVFKAGAEFSGVPAGCQSIFDEYCGNGSEMTGAWWGAKVRAMYPGYTGYRPRVQLWHGTADMTINYQNQIAAVDEWTNVLGLSATPNSTSAVTLNSHQWTRNEWQNSCGYTVLDEWSETNGPHGTDANLNAQYVIPFLGLDTAGAVDPEVAKCGGDAGSSDAGQGTGSDGSAGIDASNGSSSGSSGSSGPNDIGSSSSSSGSVSSGSTSVGSTSFGSTSVGSTSGASTSGGSTGPGGASSGGSSSSVASSGSSTSMDGTDGGSAQSGSQSAGCGCHVGAGDEQARITLGVAGLLGVVLLRRRRRS